MFISLPPNCAYSSVSPSWLSIVVRESAPEHSVRQLLSFTVLLSTFKTVTLVLFEMFLLHIVHPIRHETGEGKASKFALCCANYQLEDLIEFTCAPRDVSCCFLNVFPARAGQQCLSIYFSAQTPSLFLDNAQLELLCVLLVPERTKIKPKLLLNVLHQGKVCLHSQNYVH